MVNKTEKYWVSMTDLSKEKKICLLMGLLMEKLKRTPTVRKILGGRDGRRPIPVVVLTPAGRAVLESGPARAAH